MNIKSQLHWKLIKGYPNKKMIMELFEIFNEVDIMAILPYYENEDINFVESKFTEQSYNKKEDISKK